jgi:hypothetical protein
MRANDATSAQACREVVWSSGMTAYRPLMQHAHVADRPADDVIDQAETDDLDLW